MSGESLEYTIVEAKKYFTIKGKINSIVQKNTEGFVVNGIRDTFVFEIKLKQPSVVYTIEFKPIHTYQCTFQLVDNLGLVLESQKELSDTGNDAKIVQFESSKRHQEIIRVRIWLRNILSSETDQVGLKYVIVRGEKGVVQNKKKESKANNLKTIYRPPVKVKQTIFSERKRGRQPTQDQLMQKAIEVSKKEAEQKMEVEQQPYSISQPWARRDYDLMDFDLCQNYFQMVNARWVESQRKLQIQKGVKQHERLSSKIQVRHLNGKKVLLDGYEVKRDLQSTVRAMGATIVQNFHDNCIVIASKVSPELAAKARSMKGVKVLKPEFIRDCQKCNALMSEKDYFHRLSGR